jgi:beta-lactamase class A
MTRFAALAALLLTSCSAPAGPALSDLERDVRLALARTAPEAKPSIWLAEADGPELLSMEADRVVPAASTIKVLILIEAHAQARSGLFTWTEETTLREEDRVGGSGSLRFERTGSTWTWLQLARRMIAESDNVASNLLLRRVGMDRVNVRAAALGLAKTRVEREFMDADARRRGLENTTTAREMGALLRALYRREILGPAECDAMIALLEHTSRGRIASGVPRDVPVGHKGGTGPALRADVGWVRLPGRPYVLSVFLDGVLERPDADEDRGIEAIEAVARAVWRRLGPSDE